MSKHHVALIRYFNVCALLSCLSAGASAQFRGNFSLPRRTYVAADRSHHVLATFTLTNASSRPLRVPAGPANLCGGYFAEITAIRPRRELKPKGIAGDCLGPSTVILAPGESRAETVDVTVLDYNNFLDTPGEYRVRLVRRLPYTNPENRPPIAPLRASGTRQEFSSVFVLHMLPARPK